MFTHYKDRDTVAPQRSSEEHSACEEGFGKEAVVTYITLPLQGRRKEVHHLLLITAPSKPSEYFQSNRLTDWRGRSWGIMSATPNIPLGVALTCLMFTVCTGFSLLLCHSWISILKPSLFCGWSPWDDTRPGPNWNNQRMVRAECVSRLTVAYFVTSIFQMMRWDLLDSLLTLVFCWATAFPLAQALCTKSILWTSKPTRHAHVPTCFRKPA